MAKRIFASSPWHLTVDKDLGHRHLNVGQLPTLISHRMWYASARIRAWGSRGAQVHVLARHFQNTFAHTSATAPGGAASSLGLKIEPQQRQLSQAGVEDGGGATGAPAAFRGLLAGEGLRQRDKSVG